MTRPEMEQVAEEAAEKALEKLFLTFGVDTSDPEEVVAFQDDLRLCGHGVSVRSPSRIMSSRPALA